LHFFFLTENVSVLAGAPAEMGDEMIATPHHDGAGRPEARVGVDAPVRGRFQNFRGCLFVSRRRGGRSLLDSNVWVPGEAGMETRRISRPGIHYRSFSSSVEQQKLSDVPNALCVNNNIDAYGCQFSPK